MKRPCLAIATAVSICVLSTPTQAAALEASSSVTISGLTFSLIDLDLSDGITPWIQFSDTAWDAPIGQERWTARVITTVTDWPDSGGTLELDVQSQPGNHSQLLSPVQASLSNAAGQGSAVIAASSVVANASTTMDGSSAAAGRSQSVLASAGTGSPMFEYAIQYDLSPNSAVRIQGQYNLSARVQAEGTAGYGTAQATFAITATEWLTDLEIWEHRTEDVADAGLFAPPTASRSGSFDFLLRNASAKSRTQELFLSTSARANLTGATIDVPEPETWVLMCAGLATSLIWRTRRNRNSQAVG